MIYENVLALIGKTPLVRIRRLNPNPKVEILAKLEYFNPGGSVKDRAAFFMIEEAERKGELTKEKIILEATSGNTGIGLALVAAVKGYRILLVMSESVSQERVKILKALGAEVIFTPSHLSTDGAIEYAYRLAREEPEKYWLADQFNNQANWKAHYYGTAMEIWEDTGGQLDMVVATMGTTGTLMGISRRMAELSKDVKVVGVEPYFGHKIQGLKNMKESYPPGIYERHRLYKIINIEDELAYETARRLARIEGIFVGMSSGAAMAGALKMAEEIKEGRIVVILPDTGERYLSTSLFVIKKTPGLNIFNTLSRRLEPFIPLEENRAKIYCCGPILNQNLSLSVARRLVIGDIICNYLRTKGIETELITNVTDIDEKTMSSAEERGQNLKDYTDSVFQTFSEDLKFLKMREPLYPLRASEYVAKMIEVVEKLAQKGYAYEKFRSLYFDISRLRPYGSLSKVDLSKIQVGKTVDLDQYEKDNPRDFTLLKRATLNDLKGGSIMRHAGGR
ncbi:MAG: cysteine synthase [Desulfatiglandales bacterium]